MVHTQSALLQACIYLRRQLYYFIAFSKSQLAAAEHRIPDLLMCPLQLRQTWLEIGAMIR